MHNQSDLPTLQWRIRCVHTDCGWQARIAALEPFTRGQNPAKAYQLDRVAGFWEDYICPLHLTVERRAVVVDTNGIALEEAQFLYVMGQVITTPIPHCPICHQAMQGGHLLEKLPFYYQSTLAMLKWLVGELGRIQHRIAAELHAKDSNYAKTLADIERDMGALATFYGTMYKNLDINLTVVPLLNTNDHSLIGWQNIIAENLALLDKAETQLQHRQAQEAHKTPATCPTCQRESVYLIEATTV